MSKHQHWTDEQASSFTPWDESEVEKASISYVKNRYGNNYAISGLEYESFRAGVAWAAEKIEKCETLKFTLRDSKVHTGSYEVYEAKLVGVREVEK